MKINSKSTIYNVVFIGLIVILIGFIGPSKKASEIRQKENENKVELARTKEDKIRSHEEVGEEKPLDFSDDPVDDGGIEDDKNSDKEKETLTVEAGMQKAANNQNKPKESEKPAIDMAPITKGNYIVKGGDTLHYIAQRANLSISHIKNINNLTSDIIYEGQNLKIQSPNPSRGATRDEEVYWLSRIIHSEAQGESYQGKLAVGNVVLNRVKSNKFPNTLYGVIFDKQQGHTQFSPVLDGTIYDKPDQESIRAARAVLNGQRPVGEALYFLNPRKSTNFWITANRKYMTTIGKHDFYY